MNAFTAPGARPIAFRFGLAGRRWGQHGPIVLLAHAREAAPRSFAPLIQPLLESGRQVIALDDPTDAANDGPARIEELAVSLAEAAVELPELEAVVAHGVAADAVASAIGFRGLFPARAVLLETSASIEPLLQLRLPVLLARDGTPRKNLLDFLIERRPLPLAA